MTGISAATSTLMESNISSTKGTTKNITVAVVPSLRSTLLASSSRRMPNQVLKAHEERIHVQEVGKVAYEWSLKKLIHTTNCESDKQIVREAS
jgi:hypothetical protein